MCDYSVVVECILSPAEPWRDFCGGLSGGGMW